MPGILTWTYGCIKSVVVLYWHLHTLFCCDFDQVPKPQACLMRCLEVESIKPQSVCAGMCTVGMVCKQSRRTLPYE